MNSLLFIIIVVASFILGYYFRYRDIFFDTSSVFDMVFIFAGLILFFGMMASSVFMVAISILLFSFDLGVFICCFRLVLREDSDDESENDWCNSRPSPFAMGKFLYEKNAIRRSFFHTKFDKPKIYYLVCHFLPTYLPNTFCVWYLNVSTMRDAKARGF